jgi:hypothetical protein
MTTTSIEFSNKGLGVADAVVIATLLPLNVRQFYQWRTLCNMKADVSATITVGIDNDLGYQQQRYWG